MNAQQTYASGGSLDTIVIGGGQAGLALGYYLSRQHRNFVILDAHPRVGDAWRQRWDSLRLFTPAKFDGLPGMPFPGDRLAFPTKDEQADYLRSYADHFALPVRTGVRVDRLFREGDRYVVTAAERRWEASRVAVATGGCQAPAVPAFADRLAPSVLQLHSTKYRGPSQLRPGDALVVGLGNSGAEIALEISRTRRTWLAGTASAEIPFRHGRVAARFALPIVRFVGMRVLTRGNPIGRRAIPKLEGTGTPLIRTKRRDLAAAGVRFVERVTGAADGKPTLAGDRPLDVPNIIWCTGFREDFGWIDLPIFDEHGHPIHRRGVVESAPGVYFLGQEFLYAMASATLPGVARDARYLADHMATHPEPLSRRERCRSAPAPSP